MGKIINLDDNKTKKTKFEIVNKSESTAEILLYGGIGEDYWDDASVSAKEFSDALKELPSTISQIDLRINSPGGSVFDGVAIFERLKAHKANVTAYIDGLSASIATVIMMAADKIILGEGSLVMIHKPMAGVFGNTQELERLANVLDKIENQMIGIYARKTGLSRLEISKMLDSGDTWFTAEEAIEAGFGDEITGTEINMRLVASMTEKAKWINSAPKVNVVNQKMAREALSNRIEEMKKFEARKK